MYYILKTVCMYIYVLLVYWYNTSIYYNGISKVYVFRLPLCWMSVDNFGWLVGGSHGSILRISQLPQYKSGNYLLAHLLPQPPHHPSLEEWVLGAWLDLFLKQSSPCGLKLSNESIFPAGDWDYWALINLESATLLKYVK